VKGSGEETPIRVLVEVTEAAERFEELIELVLSGDTIVICRDERPIATLMPMPKTANTEPSFLELTAEGRKSVPPGTTSDHSDWYDEHGLPK
jgi:antitoxin (DNA-binding transcriptional repressor) of toxin-antitoxin stability system